MSKEKKALLLLWTYLILIFTPKSKSNNDTKNVIYNEDYIDENTPYGTYKMKDIYIINDPTTKDYNENNIYIIDDRNDKDPDMSVYNSYKYNNINDIKAIINILLEYENKYPTEWDRTYKSMKNEWLIHNICYQLHIQRERAGQVDFNNEDEEIYLDFFKIIKEILDANNTKIETIKTKILVKEH